MSDSADDLVRRIRDRLASSREGKEALSALSSPAGSQETMEATVAEPVRERQRCLLLDVSGSMAEEIEPGRSKWKALRSLLGQFPLARLFAFSSGVVECRMSTLPGPRGNTDMARAFQALRHGGVRHAVLITDGIPDDEDAALREAKGLRLDIFYVGPVPRPAFLDRLARMTGGSAQSASLKAAETPRLISRVRDRLALPPGR